MLLLMGLLIGMFGLMVGEVVILVWFIIRVIGLSEGKTNFIVPVYIPIIYIVYMIPICLFVFSLENGIMFEGDFVPVATRLSNAIRLFLLVNLTTPLFPLLAWLKSRAVKKMKATQPAGV